jgi:hypothetical protein
MTHWQAAIDSGSLAKGVKLTLSSNHHVVSLSVADTLAIEAPGATDLMAVVLARGNADLRIGLDAGQAFDFLMFLDESLHPPGPRNDVFSRQVWVTQ